METPVMENTPHNNINYYKKDENNKKETILTNNISIRNYLKEILDSSTIVNLLNLTLHTTKVVGFLND